MSEGDEWRAGKGGPTAVPPNKDPFVGRAPYQGRRPTEPADKLFAGEVIPPAPRPASRRMPRPALDTPVPAPTEPILPVLPVPVPDRPRWRDTLEHFAQLAAWWPASAETPAKDIIVGLLSRRQVMEGTVDRVLGLLEAEKTVVNRRTVTQALMSLYPRSDALEEAELLVALESLRALQLPPLPDETEVPLDTLTLARVRLFQLSMQLDQLWGHAQWSQASATTASIVAAVSAIARELTVAWCQQQQIADRNRVFREILVLATEAALSECSRRWWSGLRPVASVRLETLWDDMPTLKASLAQLNAGHAPEGGLFEALLAEFKRDIAAKASRYPAPSWWGFYQQEEWRSTVFRVLADMMGAAWRDAVKEMGLRIAAMSPEEVVAWESGEGDRPMPLGPVLEGFERKVQSWQGPCTVMQFDVAGCVQAIRERLTMLWGVSDALSKAH